ncbi:thioesterase II family protein [Amycolatopsis sp. lyj-112]|uniref:thioesterase II family protein n=1 Tax=Amycolatopsis sp. lyj-112 TaxID=2789288 RepID=UPI00397E5B13
MTARSGGAANWVRVFHPGGPSAPRLVCLPDAGEAANAFFPLSGALAPEVEVLAMQYPGRQDRAAEPCARDIAELADQVTHALSPWDADPVAVYGHGMGALVGFEVARRLEQVLTGSPAALIVSGCRAPSRPREVGLHLLSDHDLVVELSSAGEATAPQDEVLLKAALPVIRADFRAFAAYRPEPSPPLRCPVTVLVGDSDPTVSIDEARAWHEHTTGAFDFQVFPGGHSCLDAQREELAEAVAAVIEGNRW